MTVRVRGKNLEVTPALKDYVEKRLKPLRSSSRLLVKSRPS